MKIEVHYADDAKKFDKSFAEKYAAYTRESIEAMNNNARKLHIQ